MTGELTICRCGPRRIIVSNSYYVLSASNDYNKVDHLTIGEFGSIRIVSRRNRVVQNAKNICADFF